MQYYALTPQDAWFFRDGRPYNHGESNQADVESLFPPPARTLTGALRAALARANGWNGLSGGWPQAVADAFGHGPNDLGALQFTGPFLIRGHRAGQGNALWPLPRHLLGKVEPGRWTPTAFLRPAEQPTETDRGTLILPEASLPTDERSGLKPAESAWVTRAGLTNILAGRLPAVDAISQPPDLWRTESRVGLKREEATLTVGEGDLYSPAYVRLCKGVALGLALSGVPTGMNGLPNLFPLGGESRLAQCDLWNSDALPPAPDAGTLAPDASGQVRFIVVLLTPGKVPATQSSIENAEVVSACMGRPLLIGGWDSLRRESLPLEPFLPAGSVWFCRAAVDTVRQVLCRHGGWIGEYTRHGFGQIAIGRWPQPHSVPATP